jgi:biotin carboxylase
VPQLTAYLRRYGFSEVFALVNKPSMVLPLFDVADPEHGKIDLPRIVPVDNVLNCYELAAAVRDIADHHEVPFLCLQDRPMFSYIAARQLLFGKGLHKYHVPAQGILRARVKPSTRLLLKWSGVESVKWTILTETLRDTLRWSAIGGLKLAEEGSYILKPICGMGSEMVKAVHSKREAYAWAEKIRHFFRKPEFVCATQQSVVVDGERFNLYSDVLVEEKLEGAEYTLDGCSAVTEVEVVAQHKETIWDGAFFGDGGIMCPPDDDVVPLSPIPPLKFTGPNRTTSTSFHNFAKAAVRNLQLEKWFFHAEISVDSYGNMRFIELNPRIPGGGYYGRLRVFI